MKKLLLLTGLATVTLAVQSSMGSVIYTDRTTFVNSLPAGYAYNNFSSVGTGPLPDTIPFSGGSPTINYSLNSQPAGNGLWGLNGFEGRAVGTFTSTDNVLVGISTPGVYWAGANWFYTDSNDARRTGSVTVGFSDGTSQSVPSFTSGPYGFLGIHSSVPISSVTMLGGGTGSTFATMDNLYLAVPEPGVIITNVLVGLAGAGCWMYRRRQSSK